jgi:hypothetical protein
MGKLADLLAANFGGPIVGLVNREITTAGVAATRVFRLDADRVGATIVNLSANKVYAAPFADVSATKGFLLGPNGGQLVLDYRDDFLTVGAEWYVRASKANSAIFAIELVAQAAPAPAPAL